MTTVRIGVVWRGEASEPVPAGKDTRLRRIFEEIEAAGAEAMAIPFAEEIAQHFLERVLAMDGVLVWVDPIMRGRERTELDALLRLAAERGVFVSAHPDVIQKMGRKEMLYQTREMPWGTDTHLYRSEDELRREFPGLLSASRARVLKQDRGSSGNGVWKVELAGRNDANEGATVRVQHAVRGAVVEEMRLGSFFDQCLPYFEAFNGAGRMIDQPYAERLSEGMIRCYMVQDRVAGFGHQYVTALLPPAEGDAGPPDPEPRRYFGAGRAEFQELKMLLESGWIAQMCEIVEVKRDELPVIWDADFLLGPKGADGEDTYMLCEVNVSSVFPIPDESVRPLALAAVERAEVARKRRTD